MAAMTAAALTVKRKGRSGGVMRSTENSFGTKCEWRLFLSWKLMISIMEMKSHNHNQIHWLLKMGILWRTYHQEPKPELNTRRKSWLNLSAMRAAHQHNRKQRRSNFSLHKQTFQNWSACSHLNLAGETLVQQIRNYRARRLPFRCLEVSWAKATKRHLRLWHHRIWSWSTRNRKSH